MLDLEQDKQRQVLTAEFLEAVVSELPALEGNVRCCIEKEAHTALADVHESIDELIHYRTHFLK